MSLLANYSPGTQHTQTGVSMFMCARKYLHCNSYPGEILSFFNNLIGDECNDKNTALSFSFLALRVEDYHINPPLPY